MNPFRSDLERERLLLARCLGGDAAARKEFEDVYENEMRKAIRGALFGLGVWNPTDQEKILDLCRIEVWKRSQTLPSHIFDLRRQLRRYTFAFAKKFAKQA